MIGCVDLFCGVGGLTHGLARGGVNVIAGIDLDPQCRFSYEENNEALFVNADVRATSGKMIREMWKGSKVSMLAGCAPCQPFSTYSRKGRAHRRDEKWNLVADFGRLIDEARPDLVTMENVPQLGDHSIFGEFLMSLRGYHVWSDIVECSVYGIPQSRKRLVLLASKFGSVGLVSPAAVSKTGASTVR